jgi:DNA topoisomerase I
VISEEELQAELKKAKLIYVSDKRPGIMRQKIGKRFAYYDSDGKKVTKAGILSRINHLVIPPAWENVWICPSPNGYLQATGYDEKGRKQYLYHQAWVEACQQNKFEKLEFFGKVLPKIRRQVKKDMGLRGLPKQKVVATVIWLLEHTLVRVGNDEYAKENNSFGLTTLRERHVQVKGDQVRFRFMGKSGVEHDVDFDDPQVAKIIKSCIELPGYELFQYLDSQGQKHTVDSSDVNNYLKEITGEDITAKDFRTWGATLLSAQTLEKLGCDGNKKVMEKNIKLAVKEVSQHLRNTTKVCRDYYIHPQVLDCYKKKTLSQILERKRKTPKGISQAEFAVLYLLRSA